MLFRLDPVVARKKLWKTSLRRGHWYLSCFLWIELVSQTVIVSRKPVWSQRYIILIFRTKIEEWYQVFHGSVSLSLSSVYCWWRDVFYYPLWLRIAPNWTTLLYYVYNKHNTKLIFCEQHISLQTFRWIRSRFPSRLRLSLWILIICSRLNVKLFPGGATTRRCVHLELLDVCDLSLSGLRLVS